MTLKPRWDILFYLGYILVAGFIVGLIVLMFVGVRVAFDKSDLLHKQNLCASARLTDNVEYLNRCNDWRM